MIIFRKEHKKEKSKIAFENTVSGNRSADLFIYLYRLVMDLIIDRM